MTNFTLKHLAVWRAALALESELLQARQRASDGARFLERGPEATRVVGDPARSVVPEILLQRRPAPDPARRRVLQDHVHAQLPAELEHPHREADQDKVGGARRPVASGPHPVSTRKADMDAPEAVLGDPSQIGLTDTKMRNVMMLTIHDIHGTGDAKTGLVKCPGQVGPGCEEFKEACLGRNPLT